MPMMLLLHITIILGPSIYGLAEEPTLQLQNTIIQTQIFQISIKWLPLSHQLLYQPPVLWLCHNPQSYCSYVL